jgi:NAD(P)-dependent dehydrogenase (short-subunit alcohol dehydrogenase family)
VTTGVAVVTGASSGIGLATAVALARRQFTVVATMRDPTRSDALRRAADVAGLKVEVAALDVTDDESVAAGTTGILERHGQIDVLVNNAGISHFGTLEEIEIDDIRRVFDVNCLGAARVTKAVLPAMRAAGSGRLIAVSSMSGVFGQPFNEAYCAAKFGLEGLYEALAPVAASVGVSVSLVEAAMVTTGFFERSLGEPPETAGPYAEVRARFAQMGSSASESGQSADEVAEVIASVATEPEPKLRYQTSADVTRLLARKLADLDGQSVMRLTQRWLS